MSWRTILLAAGLAAILVIVNTAIGMRETVLRDGETVLLELAPVDPRSIMQGDYMALEFALADNVRNALHVPWRDQTHADDHADGYAVLTRDADGRAGFVRVQPAARPLGDGEIALRYRLRGGTVRIVTNAWFFAEGQGDRYAVARFGELRVGDNGEALLVAMRDAELKPL